jgi:hypothetical protein
MQTSYSQYGAASFRGLLDGVGPHNIRSYSAEAAIAIGAPVRLGTLPEKQVLTANAGATTIGFALHDQAREQAITTGLVQYAAKESVSVLTQGRFWALTSDAVVAGAVANLTLADGTLTDAAVGAGIEAFTKISVVFITGTTAAGLAIVEIK